eukprot:SAG31_NODE_1035_length_10225_cov_2.372506_2_plen_278_part_00
MAEAAREAAHAAADRCILQLKPHVDQIVRTVHHYFPADPSKKHDKLRALIAAVNATAAQAPHDAPGRLRAQVAYLNGKALDADPADEHGATAVALLSKAVKLNPSLIAAWNCLGECFLQQKPPHVSNARHCFERALKKEHNAISLRGLSRLLRQHPRDEKDVAESVALAKTAIALDVQDAESWCMLGNAYMSDYFHGSCSWSALQSALTAYNNAEKNVKCIDETDEFGPIGPNPDLYFNRGMVRLRPTSRGCCQKNFDRLLLSIGSPIYGSLHACCG